MKKLIKTYNLSKQKGNTLLLMIFIIIVMSALSGAMLKISWSQADTTAKEISSLKASLLSTSGMEVAMTKLYPPLDKSIAGGTGGNLDTSYAQQSIAACNSNSNNPLFGFTFISNGCQSFKAPTGNICDVITVNISASKSVVQYHISTMFRCDLNTEFESTRQAEVWTKDMAQVFE